MFLANKLNKGGSLGGYQISRSLRFNSPDSAYLNRTPASATNQSTWTFSTWVKRNTLDNIQTILSAGNPTSGNYLVALFFFNDNLDLAVYNSSGTVAYRITSTALYRDVSAWYHVMAVVDTTQATSSNRLKLYINGSQITSFSTSSYPPQNDIFNVNGTVPHFIGTYSYNTSANLISCNQTETYLIDGQALTPSYFGQTNAQTGVWEPIAYAGTYGTNGFYLNFSDNSNTTAATLGKDYSGNGNNWTPNNFSVTAGAGNDSLVDSPTSYGTDTGVGGSVRGNYCTMNPLSAGSYVTLSDGNLRIVGNTATNSGVALSTIGVTTGLWYWETTCVATGGLSYAGFGKLNSGYSSLNDAETFLASYGGGYRNGGQIYGADRQITTTSTFGDGDIIGIALDMTNGAAYLSKNGTFLNSGVPTSGSSKTGAVWAWTPSSMTYAICPAGGGYNNSSNYLNLGQRPFSYTAPSGFKALCTQNLPTPTIGATTATQAGKYYNAVLWTGNGSAPRAITGLGFQPDWVWGKARSIGFGNILYDSVRGTGTSKSLSSNSTDAEGTSSLYANISSFDSDGFTIGTTSSTNVLNDNGYTFVGWGWRASNATAVTNTSGSITSTVSANTTSGFSVVTYTGNATSGATVGHGLGVAPSMVIVKRRDSATNWVVYNSNIGATKYLYLNLTDAAGTYSGFWNNTAPTSSVFSLGSDATTNPSSGTMVAYCFAEVAGYSKFGSYTGNGSADGPFVFTGMRPAYLLVKNATSSGDWIVVDAKRNTYNMMDSGLQPNGAYAEASNSNYRFDFLSNGFKVRTTNFEANQSGNTIIFMAFAEAPLKFSLAR